MNVRTKSRMERVRKLSNGAPRIASALFLALCLVQQPVYAAEPAPPRASAPIASAAPNEDPPVCAYQGKTNPPPGQNVRLVGDDEILLSYRNTTTSYLRNKVINETGGALSVATALSKDFSDSAAYPRLSKSSWLAAAAPDMTGDHKAELVTALRDSGDSLGAVAYPFAGTVKDAWENSDDRYDGGTFRDVDVAAGNLDKSKKTDGSSDFTDEVVVAFRDDFADIHLVALDGATNGTLANTDKIATADYFLDHHRRNECGDVNHVAVATGDLNADGFDDEIVTVFKDDGNDLQVLVWRMSGGTFTMLYGYDSYSATPRYDNVANATDTFPNKRPIDVTTGDLDGDLEDEIVVAFRNGDAYASTIQLIAFDNTSTSQDAATLTMDYRAQKEFNISYGHPSGAYNDAYTANTVSLAAGDFDGDGMDEIGLGYNWMWFDRAHVDVEGQETHLVAFDYFAYKSPEWLKSCNSQTTSCIVQRSGRYWSSSVGLPPQYTVTIAAGDLDRNGKDEIALGASQPEHGRHRGAHVQRRRRPLSAQFGDDRLRHGFRAGLLDRDG